MTKVIYGDKRHLGLAAAAVDLAFPGQKAEQFLYQRAAHPLQESGDCYQINNA